MDVRLSEGDSELLNSIRAPEIVAVPYSDAHQMYMCVLPDGEIRHYGYKKMNGEYKRAYISSPDAGLSWKCHPVTDDNENGPMTRSPWSGDFIALECPKKHNRPLYPYNSPILPALNREEDGVYVIRSSRGPGSNEHSLTKISDSRLLDIRQPMAMLSRKRWLCTTQKWHEGALCPVVLLSDDDGFNWQEVVLEPVKPHEQCPPHQGVRWQQYSCEPTVVELSNGRLMMLSRTSQDFHYVYYSDDAGEGWTIPVASDVFHATTTMPTLLRLDDGRIMLFWCNTQPLPELDHNTQPELSDDEKNGVWEDVFTNRDACHAAISSDNGKTWNGFREINLNAVRNNADYRSVSGSDIIDKSVHQFAALELPHNKILLAMGQAPCSRKIVIFDLDWLYEKERYEDFSKGLDNISTHVYVKSLSGGKRDTYPGHCAWNRTNGALLLPSPDGTRNEVLRLARIHDKALFSEVQGAAWNFPASRKGEATVLLRIEKSGVRISLTDRWFNPVDTSVAEQAQISLSLKKEDIPSDVFWTETKIVWDLDALEVEVRINGTVSMMPDIKSNAPAGLSYLHLQSTADMVDHLGTYIKEISMKSTI